MRELRYFFPFQRSYPASWGYALKCAPSLGPSACRPPSDVQRFCSDLRWCRCCTYFFQTRPPEINKIRKKCRWDRNEIHLSRHSHLTSYGRTMDGGPTTDSDRRRAEDTHNGGRPTERRRKEIGGPTTDNEGQATDDHRQLTDNQCARCLLWPWCHVELDTETIKKRISDLLCRNANRYEHTPRMQLL